MDLACADCSKAKPLAVTLLENFPGVPLRGGRLCRRRALCAWDSVPNPGNLAVLVYNRGNCDNVSAIGRPTRRACPQGGTRVAADRTAQRAPPEILSCMAETISFADSFKFWEITDYHFLMMPTAPRTAETKAELENEGGSSQNAPFRTTISTPQKP